MKKRKPRMVKTSTLFTTIAISWVSWFIILLTVLISPSVKMILAVIGVISGAGVLTILTIAAVVRIFNWEI